MKLIMTLVVRDEEDIVGDNIAYHLDHGVDFIIATDNLSQDRTPAILKSYERRGLLHYIRENRDDFAQGRWVTLMARMAVDIGADWVINNDADEFWWPENGHTLKSALATVPSDADGIHVQRSNFLRMTNTDPTLPYYHAMHCRDLQSVNPLGKPLPGKIAHRADKTIIVDQGNHAFRFRNRAADVRESEQLQVFHYPLRGYAEFEQSILLGGASYARNNHLPVNVGSARRALYEMANAGTLRTHYQQMLMTEDERQRWQHSGRIVVDTRLAEVLAHRTN